MVITRKNVRQRGEHSLTLEGFRGVDFTSSPLRVDPRRAVRCRNLLPVGGRNVKRRGWRQEAVFTEYDTATGRSVPQPVRGMWWYTWNDVPFLLVHAGERLYASARNGGDFTEVRDGMGSEISEAFAYGKRLYMVGHGEYLVYGTWDGGKTFELRAVADDEDTYVPRTTMAINPTTNEAGEPIEDTRRSLDAVNLLCSRRVNTCMGRKCNNDNPMIFYLDAAILQGSEVVVEIEGKNNKGELYTTVYKTWIAPEISGEANFYLASAIPNDGTMPSVAHVGTVYYGAGKSVAWMTLSADCPPPIEGRDNITVTFRHAGAVAVQEAAKIGGCRFGIMFGGGGNADRLCLAGNPDYPNYQFFSGFRDPTYFPDNGWNAVGSDASAIVGFSRISDGVLAVFKEEGRGEPVIYYQTAEDVPVYADDDGQELVGMRFKLYTDAGNAGESIVSRAASVDFFGDPLILSKNGVFGIAYKTNVETADRYAAERSRNIRADLVGRDLTKACGAVFEGKYWLCVDGVCYVADEGYTFRPSEGTSGYQYEWWPLDNVPATVLCVADGRLCFGTEDGRLCYFVHEADGVSGADNYRDVCWDVMLPGAVGHDADDLTRLTVSDEAYVTLRVGDRILVGSPAYALRLGAEDYSVVSGTVVLADPNKIVRWRDGDIVYADQVGESGLAEAVPYTVGEIDRGWGTFMLFDAYGAVVDIKGGGFRLGSLLTDTELHVKEMIPDEEDGLGGWIRVSGYEGGSPMTMMLYGTGGALNNLYGEIVHVDTVTAEWYTPFLDLGDNAQTKTLTGMTVATEPGHSGRVSFGYETRDVTRLAAQTVGMGGLDLTALSFNEFSLSAFAGSWTVRLNERNINYIAFRWQSEEPSDCRVDSLTARYTVTGGIRGGL